MEDEELKKGEGLTQEFKRELPVTDRQFLKTVVAFANGMGGRIVFGVNNEDGQVVGVDDENRWRIQDRVTNMISDGCVPQIFPTYDWEEVEGKPIFIVNIPASFNCPYYLRKEGVEKGTYIRVDATTRRAEPEKIIELQLYGQHRTYDSIVERGVAPAPQEEIRVLCSTFNEYLNEEDRLVTVKQLVNWKLLEQKNDKYLPTVAFRLLVGSNFPFSGIQCARFEGRDRSVFIDRKVFDGPVHEQLEGSLRFVRQYLRLGSTIEGVRRKDKEELPVVALREAIANAIIHRNYLIPGMIQVSVFDNRLEISSPGALYGGLTKQQMLNGVSRLRNPLLAAAFRRMNIVEQWGTGVQRIFAACQKAGIKPPSYQLSGDSLCVCFPRKSNAVPSRLHAPANSGRSDSLLLQEKIVRVIRKNPQFSTKQIASALHITPSRADYHLRKMQQEKLIARDGSKKTGSWVIVK